MPLATDLRVRGNHDQIAGGTHKAVWKGLIDIIDAQTCWLFPTSISETFSSTLCRRLYSRIGDSFGCVIASQVATGRFEFTAARKFSVLLVPVVFVVGIRDALRDFSKSIFT